MNKMIQMGDTVSVSFEGRTGTKSVYKVSGYKKNKPEDWLDEDFYVEAEDGETVTAVFVGSADETDFNDETVQGIPNRPALEDGVNEITIKSGGKEYYAAIYLVRCSERVGHATSGGIVWDSYSETFEFEEMGWVSGLWASVFGSEPYEDDFVPISIEADEVKEVHHCCGGHCHSQEAVVNMDVTQPVDMATPPPSEPTYSPPPEPTWTAPEPTPPPSEPTYSPPEPSYSPPPPPPSYDSGSSSSSSYDSGSSSW